MLWAAQARQGKKKKKAPPAAPPAASDFDGDDPDFNPHLPVAESGDDDVPVEEVAGGLAL